MVVNFTYDLLINDSSDASFRDEDHGENEADYDEVNPDHDDIYEGELEEDLEGDLSDAEDDYDEHSSYDDNYVDDSNYDDETNEYDRDDYEGGGYRERFHLDAGEEGFDNYEDYDDDEDVDYL